MPERTKCQQQAMYELIATEVSYVHQIVILINRFMPSITTLKLENNRIFNDIDNDKLFLNIQDVINVNLLFWNEILLPTIKRKLEQDGLPMNPSDLKNGFINVKLSFFFDYFNIF